MKIQLRGRIFIEFDIETVTGLHIGGSDSGVAIGGVDKIVIRDPMTDRPYIPGSSLKGKIRSLLEKYQGLKQNKKIGKVYIHTCEKHDAYQKCAVCQIFGIPGGFVKDIEEKNKAGGPTRLIVRDVLMSKYEADRIQREARMDMPFTEVKSEVAIDRVTSAASPRQMERVIAGTVFNDGQMILNIFDIDDKGASANVEYLHTIIEGMQLLEDDYLGGLGSRGSGRIRFSNIHLRFRGGNDYLQEQKIGDKNGYPSMKEFAAAVKAIESEIKKKIELQQA